MLGSATVEGLDRNESIVLGAMVAIWSLTLEVPSLDLFAILAQGWGFLLSDGWLQRVSGGR